MKTQLFINFKSFFFIGSFKKYKNNQQNNELLSNYHQVSTLTNTWSIFFTELLYPFLTCKKSEREGSQRHNGLDRVGAQMEAEQTHRFR